MIGWVLLFATFGCDRLATGPRSANQPGQPDTKAVAEVRVEPNRLEVEVGESRTLSAAPVGPDGQQLDRSVSWTSTDSTVLTVEDGRVTGISVGKAQAVASVDGVSSSSRARVVQAPVARIELSTDSVSLTVEQEAALDAHAITAGGDTVDRSVRWSVSDTAVLGIQSDGTVTAKRAGEAAVRASIDSVSRAADVHVARERVAEVAVSPDSPDLSVGDTASLRARALDGEGERLDRKVTWSSTNESVATVDEFGVVTGWSAGRAGIVAEVDGVADTAFVQVTERAVASVALSPDSAAVPVDSVVSLSVAVKDSSGAGLSRTVTWSSSNTSVATVDGSGRVTGQAEGSTQVVSSVDGVADTARIVIPAPRTPGQVTDLAVSSATDSSVRVSWTEVDDGTGDPASYALRYGSPTMDSWTDAQPTEQTVAGDGIGSEARFTFTGLEAGTDYEFRLVAYRGTRNGDATVGPLSNVASATTESTTGSTTSLATVSGDGQTGTVGDPLADPLVVEVTDGDGAAVAGEPVSWSVVSGDGSVSASSTETGTDGRAQVSWTLGATAGTQEVRAVLGSGDAVVLTATAEAGEVSSVEVSPSSPEVEEGSTVQLEATLEDDYGNPVSGSVTWSSSNTSVATVDDSGLVEGMAAGDATITATADGTEGTATVTVSEPDSSTGSGPAFADGFESGSLSTSQNGYGWGNSVNATVAADAARSGSYGLWLTHPAKPDGEDSVAQINLIFGQQVAEVWIEYWMRVPDNYYHRDSSGPDNNKFFQVYGGSRSDPAVGIISEVEHWSGKGDSQGVRYLPHETGDIDGSQWVEHKNVYPIRLSERGQWIRWRWHIKTSDETSASGPWDGVVEVWKGNDLLFSDSQLPIRNDDSDRQDGLDVMRLLGWSNSGYSERTAFGFDDLKIYSQDPGW